MVLSAPVSPSPTTTSVPGKPFTSAALTVQFQLEPSCSIYLKDFFMSLFFRFEVMKKAVPLTFYLAFLVLAKSVVTSYNSKYRYPDICLHRRIGDKRCLQEKKYVCSTSSFFNVVFLLAFKMTAAK